MTILANANAIGSSGVDVGDIAHSLRFAASRSCYASRTPGSSSNRRKWTLSAWVRLGALSGSSHRIWSVRNGSNYDGVYFTSGELSMEINTSTSASNTINTNALHRDPSSWYHVVATYDGDNGTAANRMVLYVNNVSPSLRIANYPSSGTDSLTNSNAYLHTIGNKADLSQYLDGYLSRICFVDGQALTPSSFGYLNTDINEWVSKSQSAVKAVVDAGGTNSFMLDFDNGSSLTTLGYDKSSKGNNWTLSGHSLTAGVNYDWMLDVPGNSHANLTTISAAYSDITVRAGGGEAQFTNGASWSLVTAPFALTPDMPPVYWESAVSQVGGFGEAFGMIDTADNYIGGGRNYCGFRTLGYGWAGHDNAIRRNNSSVYSPGTYAANANICCAYKPATRDLWLRVDGGSWIGGGDPAAGTSPTITLAAPTGIGYYIACSGYNNTVAYINAGQRPYAQTKPSGFYSINQANMPDVPSVYLNPRKHADVALWTGNNTVRSITQDGNGNNLQFNPDLIWGKSRGSASGHLLYDIVRGVDKSLATNNTLAEDTTAGQLTAFSASPFGFQLPTDTSGYLNYNLRTYVAWLLKAGGAGVSNTAGSITSTVSANQDVGFSIVTYTGNETKGASVGHGLKVNGIATAPGLIITHGRSLGGYDWPVYHLSLTSGYSLILNGTGAQQNTYPYFNSAAPTSSVFYLPGNTDANRYAQNKNLETYVAYCFAPGFFSIGSYTGNGSADGPYVHTGHKTRWLMVKNASAATWNWFVFDSARNTYNAANSVLLPNDPGAEITNTAWNCDLDSSGFKIRGTNGNVNNSGDTYIYISIPDVFAKYSLAR